LAFFLLTGIIFGQTFEELEEGNLVGVHAIAVHPNPDVTENEFMEYFRDKLIPAYEENFPGLKIYLTVGERGEYASGAENGVVYGLFFVFDSIETRNKYWPEMDVSSELAQQNFENFSEITAGLNQLGYWTTINHTDWIIIE